MGPGDGAARVAVNARAAVREETGGVERLAREMAQRLPRLTPDRYRVVRPPAALAHRAGHLWEQAVLPARANGCALIYSPANLAPLASRRNVLVLHDVAALRHPEAYSRPYVAYQRRMLPSLVGRARMLITVSAFSKSELVEVLGISPDRVTVIPEGVSGRFRPDAGSAFARERYDLSRPYVVAVGTVSERKNLGALEQAARALDDRGIELVVAGSDRGYLRAAPITLRRLGYVAEADLPGLYAAALALALPSRYEGFGLPCLEAMASGTPVVAAAAGALPETVGDAGLLIDPDDPAAFADALLLAACDEPTRERVVAAGLARAGHFTWERTASLTDAAIGSLL